MKKKKKNVPPAKKSSGFLGFFLGVGLGLTAVLTFAFTADARPRPPEPAQTPPPAPIDARETRIAVVGDMIFSRRVAERLPEEGWAGPFNSMRPYFADADIVFGNLETSASFRGSPFPGKHPAITFRAPPGVLLGLKHAGFSVLSLANNHINDFGPKALTDTVEGLDVIGIAHCGAGKNAAEAARPAVVSANGKRFAFLAYVEKMWSVIPADAEPGAAIIDRDRIIGDIRSAAKEADFVLVSVHWGEEMQGVPREADREMAHAFIDAGAAAVIGHHPHVLQGAELYRGKPILYSLGNFIFDMISEKTYESAAATITFGSEGPRSVSFMPLRIDAETFAPAPSAGDDARSIGAILTERSAKVGGALEESGDGRYLLRPTGAYRTTASRADSSSSE